jgi:hypothetical protein
MTDELKCNLCEKKFTRKENLLYHENNIICKKEKKNYECINCDKKFSQKSHFDNHQLSKSECNPLIKNQNLEKISQKELEISSLLFQSNNLKLELSSLQSKNIELESTITRLENRLFEQSKLLKNQSDLSSDFSNNKLNIIEHLFLDNKILSFDLYHHLCIIIYNYHLLNRLIPIRHILDKLKFIKNYSHILKEHILLNFNNHFTKQYIKFAYSYLRILIFEPSILDQSYTILFDTPPPPFTE